MPEVTDPNLLAMLNGGGAPRGGPISSGVKMPTPAAPPTVIDYAKEARDAADFAARQEERGDKAREKQEAADKITNSKTNAAGSVRVLLQQLDGLERDVTDNSGFGETGTSGALMRSVPILSNAGKDLAAKLVPIKASNAFTALAKLGEEGVKLTPISNVEIELAAASIANLDPNMSQEEFLAAINTAREKYRTTLNALEEQSGEEPEAMATPPAGVDESKPLGDPNAPLGPSGPNYQAGPVEKYVTDEDRQRQAKMQTAYDKGASIETLNQIAQSMGLQPIPEQDAAMLMDARQRGQRVNISPFATGEQGLIEKGVSYAADSPPGAYFVGAANGLTLGGLDEIAGMVGGEGAGERAQFAKEYSRENSPIASMVGEVAGIGALSVLPGGAAIATGRGGVAAGGAYGALDMNDNRLLGAGVGLAGGALANKYAPQITNALAGVVNPAITRGKNVLASIAERMPGAEGRAVARQEVAQNADVIAAGQAENISVRQPDVRPSLRDQYGGAEASQRGGPVIQKAASEDAQAIANRLNEIGGGGTSKQGYNLGSETQDAVKVEKEALKDAKAAMYRRVSLQAPNFTGDSAPITKAIDDKIAGIKKTTPKGNETQIDLLTQIKDNLGETGISVESLQANRGIVRAKMKKDNLSFTPQEVELLEVLDTAAIELEKTMKASGNDAAHATLQRANKMNREYIEFKRDVVKTIVGTNNQPVSPEQAAQRLLAMVKPGGSSDKFATIYKSLPADEKAGFKALIVENLGKNGKEEFSLPFLVTNLTDKNTNIKSLREIVDADEFQSLMNLRTLANAKDKAMGGKNFSNTQRTQNNKPEGFGGMVRGLFGFAWGDVAGATAAIAGPTLAERIGTARTVKMLLNTDFSKWMVNLPNTANPRAIDAYLARLDRIKAPAVASNVVILKDYLRQTASQSPRGLAAEDENN